ncbi:uncharacterized protein N7498_001378 [Penicillium cinerascens]|uniref:HMG box domain-containing protein n=1 Tax=Penicillium cinerascens TaxID=70096 RepID=A0A9W9NIH5_9EURO|nr:uncharacterized protein N7498_001378 [Penicillium cinerascens]KAJ5219279.1 hypothetical protein N7498_001378 [Penicillium cinerascens]
MAPKQDSEATVAVNIEELRASKDAIIMWSMSLQSQIADFSKAYVEHVNNVINGTSASIDLPAMPIGMNHLDFAPRAGSPGAKSEAGGRKKRKRAPVDPNAPKRPLTPYFLYMHNNRPRIAEDLGADAKPKNVAEEGTRRWQNMDLKEKEIWKAMYGENYEKYKVDSAAYNAAKAAKESAKKAGEEDNDPSASQLQQDFAGAEAEDSSDDEEESSSEESPSPIPPKEKTPPRSSNKRRRSDAKVVKEAKEATPAKKGKGKTAEPTPAKEKVPEKRSRAKKRKSEA